MLQKRFTGKTRECSKHLCHIATEKDILSELNRYILQISLKYIKLVIPKILALCSFNFYFKITSPPQQYNPTPLKYKFLTPPAKTFVKFITPKAGGECMPWCYMKMFKCFVRSCATLLNKMLFVDLGVGKMFYSSTMLEFDHDDGIRF